MFIDITWTITLEVHLGKDLNRYHQVGKYDETYEVVFIMWIIIQEVLHGKDQIQKDYNTFNSGKEKDNTLFNKETKDFCIRRYNFLY